MRKYLVIIVVFIFQFTEVMAQCPMCRKNAEMSEMASGLNNGIFYLLFAPFVLLGGVGLLWYFNREKFGGQETDELLEDINYN